MDTVPVLDIPMAEEAPKRLSVKLPADVIDSARLIVALRKDTTISDLITGILRPVLAEMEREAMARRSAPTPKKKGGPR